MTARDRDPQGVSGPPADLTRIAAIRERLGKFTRTGPLTIVNKKLAGDLTRGIYEGADWVATVKRLADCEFLAHAREDVDWLLARLAPATPSGAATAEDSPDETAAREERTP